MKKTLKNIIMLILLVIFVQGCATTANFSSIPENAQVTIGKTQISGTTPQSGSISRTTFGRYPVKAEKEGYEPIYGNLPLKVSPGVIILDALFFAPAAFFNVQGSFSSYAFDFEKGLIKYKKDPGDGWSIYNIPDDQKKAARTYFGD